jgi:alkylation response protein AidB-like acyl-CoA dehydrogenase
MQEISMSTPNHYKSNLRDAYFNLFEVLDISKNTLSHAPYKGLDEATLRELLRTFEKICVEKMATSFVEGDTVPLQMDNEGNVTLPKGLKEALLEFQAAGWHLLGMSEDLNGMGAPHSAYWSAFEMLVGANPPAAFYLFGTFVAQIVKELGTESQKKRYLSNFVERNWGATMVLTEPDAGSDVGSGRAKARHIKDDVWEIEGVKRFITNGDFNATENIVHMVLARPEGADVGTKGLSVFLVPKFWVDENGKMGERNGVYCTNLEKKMGIKGSATCEVTFGEKTPARGLLLGNVHDGIRQMFKVIEQARMAVGVKSMATLSTAYLNALEFCRDRVQGPDLAQAMDKHSPRVKIIAHPDVRRMLMMQKSHAEGMRAMCLLCAHIQDKAFIAQEAGDSTSAKTYFKYSDFLLPLIKGYNSEKAYDLLAVSLQCYGGSGYLKDYPIEQYIRDQKIDSLYEGTTHIQALDLIFRKIAKDGGATLNHFLDDIRTTISSKTSGNQLGSEYELLATGLKEAEMMMGLMMQKMAESIYYAGLHGNRVLNSIAELIIAGLLVKHAEIGLSKREKAVGGDKDFYDGKIASARFYCQQALPNLTMNRKVLEKATLQIMDLPEAAF